MFFKIVKSSKKTQARIGVLTTLHGKIPTPFFMPTATKGAIKGVPSWDIVQLGIRIILANTYHLFLRPGEKIISQARQKIKEVKQKEKLKGKEYFGGLHRFMNWPYAILTDSGGFQIFSLAKFRKIKEEGVEFQSDFDGKKYLLTPEKSIEIQFNLGSDIIMVLDECVGYPADREYLKKSVDLTSRWARRSKEYFKKRIKNKKRRPMLFGIVQGGIDKELRKKSLEDLLKLDFDGYAIGGLAVGEPKEKMWEIVEFVNKFLPKNKPRYLMGVGKPEDIVWAVNLGCDMFDCVIPTRNARHGELFKFKSPNLTFQTKPFPTKFYEKIHILNSKWKDKFIPIDAHCSCPTCQNFTFAYLHHLFRVEDYLGEYLATLHNLKFYIELMEKLRQEIRQS